MKKIQNNLPLFLPLLLVLLWSGVFIWQSSFIAIDGFRKICLFDDFLISLRYSWNLAHGEGLVWNPGERVEGFTSLLWALLLSLPATILDKGSLVLFVQLLGIALLLGMGYFSSRIAQALFRTDLGNSIPGIAPKGDLDPSRVSPHDSGDRPYAGTVPIIAFLLPTLYYPISFLTLGGMETGLLTFLVLASLDRTLRTPPGGRPDWLLAVLLGLSILARPDAALFAGGILLFHSIQAIRNRDGFSGISWEWTVVAVIAGASELFRWMYFGELVPNTYTLKVAGIPLSYRLPNGVSYVLPVLPPLLLPLLMAIWGNFRDRLAGGRLIISLVLLNIGYTVWVGGDFIPHPRFIAPLVPPLLLLGTRGVSTFFPRPKPGLAPVVLLLLTLLAAAPFLPDLVFARPIHPQDNNEKNTNAAIVLLDLLKPEAKVAVTWAGAIPYWTGFRGVDLYGKCDPVIARSPFHFKEGRNPWGISYTPGHNRYDFAYSIIRLKPDFAQTFLVRNDQYTEEYTRIINKSYLWIGFPGVNILDAIQLRKDSSAVDWEAVEEMVRTLNLEVHGLAPWESRK